MRLSSSSRHTKFELPERASNSSLNCIAYLSLAAESSWSNTFVIGKISWLSDRDSFISCRAENGCGSPVALGFVLHAISRLLRLSKSWFSPNRYNYEYLPLHERGLYL